MIFCELGSRGFSRYSFMTIFECSSQSFQASFETLSKTRLPISPRHGMRSSPGRYFSKITDCRTSAKFEKELAELDRMPWRGGSSDRVFESVSKWKRTRLNCSHA